MGTEEFWVPAVIAALGTGTEAVNQKQAANRADDAEAQAIRNQSKIQGQGVAAARKTIDDINASNPNKIAATETGKYVDTLRKNAAGSANPNAGKSNTQAGGPTSSLGAVPGGSSRYSKGVSDAATEVANYGDTYAGEQGQIDAAIRQRENEGNLMTGLSTAINSLNARSQSQGFIDQLRAQTAGQANPWANLLGGMLKGVGSSMATNWNPGGTGVGSKLLQVGQGGYTKAGTPLLTGEAGIDTSGLA